MKPKVLRKKRGPYNTQKSRGSRKSQKTQSSQRSRRTTNAKARSRPTQSTQKPTQLDTQFDESQGSFAYAPTPNVLGNDGRYGEMVEDPVSQFATQASPNVPTQVPSQTAMERFAELQQKSRSRVAASLWGEPNRQPPRRQTTLPGQVMRRKVSQNRFVSDPNLRLLQRRPVRPIRLDAPLPQFRQLPLRAVINNLHDVVDLTLEQWRQMGFSEFDRHDVIVKIPGAPLTRYRLVSSFRQDFENPQITLSSSNGSSVPNTHIRGSH